MTPYGMSGNSIAKSDPLRFHVQTRSAANCCLVTLSRHPT